MDKKLLLFSILLLLAIALAACLPAGRVSAATLELDCDSQTGCDFCDFIALTAKISKIILGLTGSLALLFFVIGGIILMTSQGNAENIESGKNMLLGSVIGVIIIFLAWTMVNFTILTLTGKLKEGKIAEVFGKPWNQIECVKPPPLPPEEKEEVIPGEGIKGCTSSWEGGTSCGGSCGGITSSGIKSAQCDDASPSLTAMLDCMNKKKGTLPLIITSVSDDRGLGYCREDYSPPPTCAHLEESCHYGGGGFNNGSYAADFRSSGYNSQSMVNAFEKLVENGCRGKFIDERFNKDGSPSKTPHFHASTAECPKY